MRIVGKHRGEYYDCLAAYDTDKETLLIRNYKEPEELKESLGYSIGIRSKPCNYKLKLYGIQEILLGFAGRFLPIMRDLDNNKIYYDKESYETDWIVQKRWDSPYSCIWDYDWNKEEWLFNKYGPVFSIYKEQFGVWNRKVVIEIHPSLMQYGLQKVIPPHEAWNELVKWRGNQASEGKPIPEMSNDIKIEQAGFNLKTSFRKPKNA